MVINAYFFDSVGGDRVYSAAQFADAFGIVFADGVLAKEAGGTDLGLLFGGDDGKTIYAGKAVIQGHFIENTVGVSLTVPQGTYSGMIVLRLNITDTRNASLEVRTDRTPQQDTTIWELPLYNCEVANGVITSTTDLRVQGGAVAKIPDNIPTYQYKNNGVHLSLGVYEIALTPLQPPAQEKLVWIQVDN